VLVRVAGGGDTRASERSTHPDLKPSALGDV